MRGDAVLHSGCGSRPAALFSGIVALVVFGGFAAVLLQASSEPVLLVLGSALGFLALISIPWQVVDAGRRRHELTERGLRYRCGIVGRFEVEIPYGAIQGVAIRQGAWQRPLGCADVRIAAPGMTGPVLISSRDYNAVVLRSIPDSEAVAELLQERMAKA